MISIESVSNFRDVSIGSKMKKNLLFRCAKLSTLNEQDIRVLENLNPHAIIDFRDPKEVKMAPDNLSPKLLAKYINLPISASTLSSCLLYTSPSPRDGLLSRMPSSA